MKPLITFLAFNRIENTKKALDALFSTKDDFEIVLLDNYSQDNTWELFESIKDSRIIAGKRFDSNIGLAPAINWGLTYRKPGQAWINLEYDCKVEQGFVDLFKKYEKVYPEYGSFSGTLVTQQEILKQFSPERLHNRDGLPLAHESLMGFLLYINGEVMDQMQYLDEVGGLLDQEINYRIQKLGYGTGYALLINCSMIQKPQCPFYSRIITDWAKEHQEWGSGYLQKRIDSGKFWCGTRWVANSLSPEELERSLMNSKFYSESYLNFLNTRLHPDKID